jgi:hypothetical protein
VIGEATKIPAKKVVEFRVAKACKLEIEKDTHMSMIKQTISEIFKFFDKQRKTE